MRISPKLRLVVLGISLLAVLASLSSCSKKSVSPPAAPPAASGNTSGGGTGSGGNGGSGSGSGGGTTTDNSAVAVEPVFFGYDSHSLDATAQAALDRNVRALRAQPDTKLTIEGHCDERGTAEYNMALGELRAQAVSRWLIAAGVAPGRISTISYGKERPFDEGHGDQSWAQNRRAQFVVR